MQISIIVVEPMSTHFQEFPNSPTVPFNIVLLVQMRSYPNKLSSNKK